MFSIFNIFRRSWWRRANVLGRTASFFRRIPRYARAGWGRFVRFFGKNKAWFAGIGAGVAAGLIVRAISKLWDAAEATDSAKAVRFGSGDGSSQREWRSYLQTVIDSASELKYTSNVDSDSAHATLAAMIIAYHQAMVNCPTDNTTDYCVTVDRLIGGAARAGITLEDSGKSSYVVSKFRTAKDNEELPEDISHDLVKVIELDQLDLPLRSV